MPKGSGPAVRAQHRLLDRVVGILSGLATSPGQPVQLASVPPEQFGEGVAVSGDMGAEKVGIGAVGCRAGHNADVSHPAAGRHFTRRVRRPRGR